MVAMCDIAVVVPSKGSFVEGNDDDEYLHKLLAQLITRHHDDGQLTLFSNTIPHHSTINVAPLHELQTWLRSRQRDVLVVDASVWVACPGPTRLTAQLCAYGRTLSASCAAWTRAMFPCAALPVALEQPDSNTPVQQVLCTARDAGPENNAAVHLLPICYVHAADCLHVASALHPTVTSESLCNALAALCVAARGLHVAQVGAAVSLSSPEGWLFAEDLVHRIANDTTLYTSQATSHGQHDDWYVSTVSMHGITHTPYTQPFPTSHSDTYNQAAPLSLLNVPPLPTTSATLHTVASCAQHLHQVYQDAAASGIPLSQPTQHTSHHWINTWQQRPPVQHPAFTTSAAEYGYMPPAAANLPSTWRGLTSTLTTTEARVRSKQQHAAGRLCTSIPRSRVHACLDW